MFIKYLCYTLLLYVRRGKRLSEKKNMRIVVFSDSHGNFGAVQRIFKQNQDAHLFIFLGDGAGEIDTISTLYPQKQILSVKGNCDIISQAPKELVYTAPDGRKIFACHGNTYSVNTTKNITTGRCICSTPAAQVSPVTDFLRAMRLLICLTAEGYSVPTLS